MIQFNQIPGNMRVPLFYAEINPGQTPYQSNARLLLIGQFDSVNGTATPNQPVQIFSNADGMFGPNSMLAAMYRKASKNAPFQEIWALPMADNSAGVAATATITVGSLTTLTPQTIAVWIGEDRVQSVWYPGDTAAQVASRLAAAIQAAIPAMALCLASASVSTNVITLTAFHKGVQGNTLSLNTNFNGGEGPASGQLFTLTAFTSGAGDPTIASAIANLGDDEFDWIACPYSDATNLSSVSTFLNGASGRWSPYQQLYGHYMTLKADTAGNLATFGLTMNDPHITIMGVYNFQSPSWNIVAAYGAVVAAHLQDAPELSRPLQTLQLIDILGPKLKGDQFTITTRQSLYFDGISALVVNRDGTVSMDRVITTYRLNPWGAPDASWLDINTLAQNMYAIRYLRTKVTGAWGRAALMDSNPDGIQGVATPAAVKNTIVIGYNELEALAVVENADTFAQMLIVERNAVDANRLDTYLPADQVNALRIIAVNYVSFLQFSNANV